MICIALVDSRNRVCLHSLLVYDGAPPGQGLGIGYIGDYRTGRHCVSCASQHRTRVIAPMVVCLDIAIDVYGEHSDQHEGQA
jgi:hypothetical protein